MGKCEEIMRAIESSKVIEIVNDDSEIYQFKKYPFGERGTYIEPKLTKEIITKMLKKIKDKNGDYSFIVSPEPGGHTWGLLISYFLNVPLNILRTTSEKLVPTDNIVLRRTAYNHNFICFDHFNHGDKVIIIDDVISSGCTIMSIINYLKGIGVCVVEVYVILVKGEKYREIEKKYNVSVSYLVKE